MRPPPGVRLANQASDRRVSWLETLFDLVFAAAVANASSVAFADYSAKGIAKFCIVFVPIWWAWIGSSFYASRFQTDDLIQRLIVMGQMASVASMAAFAPTALGKGSMWFAIAYSVCRLLLIAQYFRAGCHIPRVKKLAFGYSLGFGLAVAVWLGSLALPIESRPYAWIAAIAIDLITPRFLVKEAIKFPTHYRHIPERFGLFTIIVLGEAVVATSAGISARELTPMACLSAFGGIVLVFALWWDYFDGVGATRERSPAEGDRGRSFAAWMYLHLPLTGCIILIAVGLKHAIADSPLHPFTQEYAMILCLVTGITMCTLAGIWATSPKLTGGRTVGQQSGPYVVLTGIPLIGSAGAGQVPPPLLIAALSGLFVGRIYQGLRDYRRCEGPDCDM